MKLNINRSTIAAIHDSCMALISFPLALLLQLGFDAPDHVFPLAWCGLILACVATPVFIGFHLYRGLWRYASLQDLVAILKASTLTMLIFTMIMVSLKLIPIPLPPSTIFINGMLLASLLGGPRFLYRIVKDYYLVPIDALAHNRIPVILAGINTNAELFMRETQQSRDSNYVVVAIVDSDKDKIGRHIYNVPILGTFEDLPLVVQKLHKLRLFPQKVIITSHMLDGEVIRSIFKDADALGLTLARLPRLSEFNYQLTQELPVRPIALEDLLGRPQTIYDREAMERFIQGKRILITGAGGTIGGELTRQIANYRPAELAIIDLSECNLYTIDKELEESYPDLKWMARLVDIRNRESLHRIFSAIKPDIVFHAAALKHVPLVESNLTEAILTNVLGTKNVADCCLAHDVKKMILISTDKAVNPTNIMGATKRIAERYVQGMGQSPKQVTEFITVRFGNVLGSSGSVIPLFQRQLANRGPLTVTHPDVERFFMTVREAVELVIQGSSIECKDKSNHSTIFVLDMGKPIRIKDLAKQMILLAGLREGIDVNIVYTGLRPGEKLKEELFHASENIVPTSYSGILLASPRIENMDELNLSLAKIIEASKKHQEDIILGILKDLVPEYHQHHVAA